jgi:hypothetical protein
MLFVFIYSITLVLFLNFNCTEGSVQCRQNKDFSGHYYIAYFTPSGFDDSSIFYFYKYFTPSGLYVCELIFIINILRFRLLFFEPRRGEIFIAANDETSNQTPKG